MSPAALLVAVAAIGLAWRCAAFLTGTLAWLCVGAIALSLVAGVAVPGSVVAGTVGLWLVSQAVTRARHGFWRSATLGRLAR